VKRNGTMNISATGLLLLMLCLCVPSTQAETGSSRAVMQWEGEGYVYKINPEEMIFQGFFEGILYFETAAGDIDGAFATCPVSQTINLEAGSTVAKGHCEITIATDDIIYSEWNCTGKLGDCRGEFKLVSGLGRFSGITGQSDFRIRSIMGELLIGAGSGTLARVGKGIALLPNLKFKIPNE